MSSNNSNMTKLWSAISIDVIKQFVQNSKKHCQIEMAMTIPSSLKQKIIFAFSNKSGFPYDYYIKDFTVFFEVGLLV